MALELQAEFQFTTLPLKAAQKHEKNLDFETKVTKKQQQTE